MFGRWSLGQRGIKGRRSWSPARGPCTSGVSWREQCGRDEGGEVEGGPLRMQRNGHKRRKNSNVPTATEVSLIKDNSRQVVQRTTR